MGARLSLSLHPHASHTGGNRVRAACGFARCCRVRCVLLFAPSSASALCRLSCAHMPRVHHDAGMPARQCVRMLVCNFQSRKGTEGRVRMSTPAQDTRARTHVYDDRRDGENSNTTSAPSSQPEQQCTVEERVLASKHVAHPFKTTTTIKRVHTHHTKKRGEHSNAALTVVTILAPRRDGTS